MNNEEVRVLMYGWELPPYNTGGLGVACYGLAKALSDMGTQIAFAMPRKLPHQIPFMHLVDESFGTVSVTAVNSLLRSYLTHKSYLGTKPNPYQHYMNQYGQTIYDEAQRFAQLASSFSTSYPHQIIHAHDWMTYPAGLITRDRSRKPMVAHVHATEYDRTGGHVDPRIADIEYQGLHGADKIIAVSHYTKNIIAQKYNVPKDKIVVVHNGVDSVEFSGTDVRRLFPHDHVVLYVGRLTFQKGVEYFLQAAKRVLEKNPNTVFLVVGDGDMYHKHLLEAAYLGISSRVIFTGFLSGTKLKSVYSLADVFVMPSVSEPYGLVALEAIASGVPVVISKQSGVAETIRHALKVDFWDTTKMADAITSVLSFPRFFQDYAHNARLESRHLTWESAAQKTTAVYRQLLS